MKLDAIFCSERNKAHCRRQGEAVRHATHGPALVATEGFNVFGHHVGYVYFASGKLAWMKLCDLAPCERSEFDRAVGGSARSTVQLGNGIAVRVQLG